MATIKPFKGVRPTPNKAAQVAALPYDVMTSKEARKMVVGNGYSFLHVDKAEIDLPESIDAYDDSVYEKAKENLNKLMADGILKQDDEPHLYIYRLTMKDRAQNGLVACTSVNEYLEGKIKKHELTLASKEKDRIRHVDTCNANTGPIFLTYRGRDEINNIINDWMENNTPVYDFIAEDGIGHVVWVIDDLQITNILIEAFEKVPYLYIADGHHRNASAVKVALDRREKNPNYKPDDEFNYYLSVIFQAEELKIMDYNRLVKDLNGLSEKEFFSRLEEKFIVEPKPQVYQPDAPHHFGLYINGKWYELVAKPEICRTDDPVAALDVSILQNHVLHAILGIDDPRNNKRIDFVGGIRGMADLTLPVDNGDAKLAFAMYPTSMEELMDIADADKIMPPKSTWFEPKLRSGLFIHSLS